MKSVNANPQIKMIYDVAFSTLFGCEGDLNPRWLGLVKGKKTNEFILSSIFISYQ
jgi:hypothetical protein